jgi:hypothetical protein
LAQEIQSDIRHLFGLTLDIEPRVV